MSVLNLNTCIGRTGLQTMEKIGMICEKEWANSTVGLRIQSLPDCRVCQQRTREFLNTKILAHLGAVYSKFYTLFWPKTLYLHCILQGFYHFSFFGWLFKRTYKYFCAPAPQCFAFVHPRSRRKVPYSAVWSLLVESLSVAPETSGVAYSHFSIFWYRRITISGAGKANFPPWEFTHSYSRITLLSLQTATAV